MVPPLPLFDAAPSPDTVSPPDEPVVFSTTPFAGPLAAVPAEMLRNSSLFAPMVVSATLSAVPVVAERRLTTAPVAPGLHGFSSQTSTVPPPVAAKAGLAPVLNSRPPEKRTVAPVLPVSETPLPSPSSPSVIAPEKALTPPVVPVTCTSWPTSSVIVPW